MEYQKNEVCLIEDFQEFGNVLILLLKRCLKNVEGDKLSNPIWEGLIVDAEHKGLRDMWQYRLSNTIPYLALSFEKDLIKLEDSI